MKTRLPRQEFQDALTAISSLTSGRTPKPIQACGHLTAANDVLEVCATDGEAALRLQVPALAIERPGEAVMKAEHLLGIVRELSDVEIQLEADDRQCTIRGSGSEFRIFVHNPADYPPIPAFGDEADLTADGRVLRRMIALTLYAAARETSAYAINGVLWDKRGTHLYMIATDGRRLARAGGRLLKTPSADFDVIVPTKALTVFERVFTPPKDGEWPVQVRVTPNQLMLQAKGMLLATALVEGRFPEYERVIPKEADKVATLDRTALHAAVRRAALLTTEDSRAVRLAFQPDQLVITSRSPEQGEARVEVGMEYQGEPMDIGFNPVFLNDALKVMPYERLSVELQESSRPGVLSGGDKDEFLYVVMPVSLSP
jgi:DNA polymerase-3 subunit beta